MRHHFGIYLLYSLLFNSAIAGLLTLINPGSSLGVNMVFSQCIGLISCVLNISVVRHIQQPKRRWALLALTFPGGIILGTSLAASLTGEGHWSEPKSWISVVIGLFFGGIAAMTYFMSLRIEKLDATLKQQQLQQSETERRELEAQLKLLQAQIEPHFLFNTLANVSSLIDSQPAAARRLLDRLNDWLRMALQRTRSSHTTLGEELAMLDNYLEILKVRFGERLHWHIQAETSTRALPFPPMLLQPLVENAIRHGLEPKIGGGQLWIQAQVHNQGLCIEVRDNGIGLRAAATQGTGTGLANVRARLQLLYGAEARMVLEEQAQGGVRAALDLPLPNGNRT